MVMGVQAMLLWLQAEEWDREVELKSQIAGS